MKKGKPSQEKRITYLILGWLFIAIGFILSLRGIFSGINTVGNFEREFQRLILGTIGDLITSPSVWIGLIFIWRANENRVK